MNQADLIEAAEEFGGRPTCWICMYATDVGEDERVRFSTTVFGRVHEGEISEAYEARARKLDPIVGLYADALFIDDPAAA